LTGDFVDAQTDLNDNWDNLDGKVGFVPCTSGTRPGAPFTGMHIYETNTLNTLVWNGTAWKRVFKETQANWTEAIIIERGASNGGFAVQVTSDTNTRWFIQCDGMLRWGNGALSQDTNLYRSGTDALKTDDSFEVVGNFTLGGNLFLPGRKRKTADTNKISDTTFATDPHLTIPMEANRAYSVRGMFLVTSATAADIKCQFTGPAGYTHRVVWETWSKATAVGTQLADSRMTIEGENAAIPTGGSTFSTQSNWIVISGVVITGGTAGNFNLQWAQNTSTASNTTMYANSWLELIPLAT
jgi:hypothetical protein